MTSDAPATAQSLSIRLNGEDRLITTGLTVSGLLEELGKDPRVVAIELNGEILPRDHFGQAGLGDGDRVEVVQFVQGG